MQYTPPGRQAAQPSAFRRGVRVGEVVVRGEL